MSSEQIPSFADVDLDAAEAAATVDVGQWLVPPQPPRLLALLDDIGASTGLLADSARTDDTRPTLSGSALAGATTGKNAAFALALAAAALRVAMSRLTVASL